MKVNTSIPLMRLVLVLVIVLILMCIGLILLVMMRRSPLQEGFLDHDIKEDRNKIRFHPYGICWMKKAKEYDQWMLRKKAGEVEMGSICDPGFIDLEPREKLDVDLYSYPELVFHPVDNPREDLIDLDL
jgi:hypothetical protein